MNEQTMKCNSVFDWNPECPRCGELTKDGEMCPECRVEFREYEREIVYER